MRKRISKGEAKELIIQYLSQYTYWRSTNMIYKEGLKNVCSIESTRKYLKEMYDDGILERRLFNRQINEAGKSGIIYGYRLIR